MSINKVLIVDEDKLVCEFLADTFNRKNIEVHYADSGTKALNRIKNEAFDLVVTEMKMADLTGIELLSKIKETSPATLVVVIAESGSIESAVEVMRLGAFNYLIKPFSTDAVEATLEKAQQHFAPTSHDFPTKGDGKRNLSLDATQLIGESPAIKQILHDIERISKSNANIFISGESGTGKEVVAHCIHYNSLRAHKPFVKVNCAAIPDTLIEAEFFGHEKGAFTGASDRKIGKFERAHGGTLLLDEVTEFPIQLQAKLLRVVQEQELERLGGTKSIKIDVRTIATSNRNILEAIEQKKLREDLYYRLNVVPIYLPPLRERQEDILILADYFLKKIAKDNHENQVKKLTPEAQKKLRDYHWPGNVRELANVIERGIVMDPSNIIDAEHLHVDTISGQGSAALSPKKETAPPGKTLRELEKLLIVETLHAQQYNRTKTAEALGISLKTLRHKLQEYKIET